METYGVRACVLSHSVVSTFSHPVDCSLPGSSVHGILLARVLERAAISSSRVLPDPGIESPSPTAPGIGKWIFYNWATRKAPTHGVSIIKPELRGKKLRISLAVLKKKKKVRWLR